MFSLQSKTESNVAAAAFVVVIVVVVDDIIIFFQIIQYAIT